jgi:hypothetical protein
MRFALLEIKLTLTKLLKKYSIVPSENTNKKFEFKEGIAFRRPAEAIRVMFKKREQQ